MSQTFALQGDEHRWRVQPAISIGSGKERFVAKIT